MKLPFMTIVAVAAWTGCAFGDRSLELGTEPPDGEPQVFRGISVVLDLPEDLRPEPHSIVGAVRSGVGVKTADLTTHDDVRDWIREGLAKELQNSGFLVAWAMSPGRALRIRTSIIELDAEEGIGFGAKMALEIRVAGDATLLFRRTYETSDRHLVITNPSEANAADSLRICLRRLAAQFARDLVGLSEASPD
jgi:hypothetical protein